MRTTSPALPTASYTLWAGAIDVFCFGRASGDWALRGPGAADAERNNPGVLRRVEALSDRHGCRIHAPVATPFNAEIVEPDALRDAWIPGKLFRGIEADAVTLGAPGLAFAVASADCPTIVARCSATGYATAAHAGRDCLYDRGALLEGASPRRHESVVHAMIEAFRKAGCVPADIRAFICCGIGPDRFLHGSAHASRGTTNAAIVGHIMARWGAGCLLGDPLEGRLSLAEIIRAQFAELGIHPSHVGHDGGDTHEDRACDGGYAWHSHRRDGDGKRNLVLVIRRH